MTVDFLLCCLWVKEQRTILQNNSTYAVVSTCLCIYVCVHALFLLQLWSATTWCGCPRVSPSSRCPLEVSLRRGAFPDVSGQVKTPQTDLREDSWRMRKFGGRWEMCVFSALFLPSHTCSCLLIASLGVTVRQNIGAVFYVCAVFFIWLF